MPIEKLCWILDKINVPPGVKNDELYQQNVDFVHSLGLKCDIVGWSRIVLGTAETDKILRAIEEFCHSNGWQARGWYEISYEDLDSDWFELTPVYFKDNTVEDDSTIPCKDNKSDTVPTIHAYRETTLSPKEQFCTTYVPLRFVKACRGAGLTNIDFCWLRDVGKYEAEQYFALYPYQSIAHIGVDWKIRKKGLFKSKFASWKYQSEDKKIVNKMGGWLPRVSNLFSELNIKLPDCYLTKDMPDGGIAIAYRKGDEAFFTRKTILIHKDIAQKLIDTKALSEKYLRPALVVDQFPAGYMSINATVPLLPTPEFLQENRKEYEAFIQQSRPIRQVSEKEALKLLRAAKRQEKENYQKAFSKSKTSDLIDTGYEALIPYYLIANGGYLSDEYELFCHAVSVKETEEFKMDIQKEELLDEKPNGIVIGKCADGDKILLLKNGAVIRFSHEEPSVIESWSTLSQFIYEVLTEAD